MKVHTSSEFIEHCGKTRKQTATRRMKACWEAGYNWTQLPVSSVDRFAVPSWKHGGTAPSGYLAEEFSPVYSGIFFQKSRCSHINSVSGDAYNQLPDESTRLIKNAFQKTLKIVLR